MGEGPAAATYMTALGAELRINSCHAGALAPGAAADPIG